VDKVDPCDANCPSRDILDLVGDRWSLLILLVIAQGHHRNGELKRRVGGISQKMLTQTLRALEANGLVVRRDFMTVPPHVEYHLTALGVSLGHSLTPFFEWIEVNFAAVQAARGAFAVQAGAA
jgi:DNA-binding HxlR family transcriptional regulator